MKLKAAAALAAMMLTVSVAANAGYEVKLNNYTMKFDDSSQYPAVIGDAVYLPLRKLAESAGGKVGWADNYVVISLKGNEIKLRDNATYAQVNGEPFRLRYPVKMANGRTMISIEDTDVLGIYKDLTQPYSGVYLHQNFYKPEERFFNIVTTFYDDPHTTRAFAWEAQTEYDDMVIEYQKKGSGAAVEQAASYVLSPVSFANNRSAGVSSKIYDAEYVSDMQNMLFYKTALTGLEPGTTYIYRVGDKKSGEWSEYFEFTTEPENTTGFSLIGVADPQGRTRDEYSYYQKTLYRAIEDCPDAAFIINMGDLTDNGNFDDWWKYFFDASIGTKESLPLMTAIGNHENRGDSAKFYNLRFYNPQNAKGLADGYVSNGSDTKALPIIGNLDNTVYSFDYGNAHFAVLNTGTDWSYADMRPLLELQKGWLENDLASTDKEWKVVMAHIGIYVQKLRPNLCKEIFGGLIDKYGVDLVLEGHDHTYMRTYQMYNDQKVSEELYNYKKGAGALYSVVGSAALKRYNSTEKNPWTAVLAPLPETEPSYTIVRFDPEKISFTAKLIGGTVIDQFTIWQ